MTIGELIEALEEYDPELPVFVGDNEVVSGHFDGVQDAFVLKLVE